MAYAWIQHGCVWQTYKWKRNISTPKPIVCLPGLNIVFYLEQ